jgi:hypothetical protein
MFVCLCVCFVVCVSVVMSECGCVCVSVYMCVHMGGISTRCVYVCVVCVVLFLSLVIFCSLFWSEVCWGFSVLL